MSRPAGMAARGRVCECVCVGGDSGHMPAAKSHWHNHNHPIEPHHPRTAAVTPPIKSLVLNNRGCTSTFRANVAATVTRPGSVGTTVDHTRTDVQRTRQERPMCTPR